MYAHDVKYETKFSCGCTEVSTSRNRSVVCPTHGNGVHAVNPVSASTEVGFHERKNR